MIDHQVNPKGEAQSAESIPLYEGEGKQCTSTVFIEWQICQGERVRIRLS